MRKTTRPDIQHFLPPKGSSAQPMAGDGHGQGQQVGSGHPLTAASLTWKASISEEMPMETMVVSREGHQCAGDNGRQLPVYAVLRPPLDGAFRFGFEHVDSFFAVSEK